MARELSLEQEPGTDGRVVRPVAQDLLESDFAVELDVMRDENLS
jgi:hypothetical protein